MTDRKAIKRILERLGFIHIAGWVRTADAPAMQRKIDAARDEVDGIRRSAPHNSVKETDG